LATNLVSYPVSTACMIVWW